MSDEFDEEYVRDILKAMPKGLKSREEFRAECQLDINAGWYAEVDEAMRRYFSKAK